jgi:hypothetical protein
MFIAMTTVILMSVILSLCQFATLTMWLRSMHHLKMIRKERDQVCSQHSDLLDELKWRRDRDENVSRQLAELAEDLADAQRAIVAVHGAEIITPERQAIITAASRVDRARTPMEAEWVSST